MDIQAWHERNKLDNAFPFRLWETSMRGFALHWHELLEIVYVLRGDHQIVVEGRTYNVTQGDIVIVNPGAAHGFPAVDRDSLLVLTQFGLEIFDHSLVDLRARVFQQLVFGRKIRGSTDGAGDLHRRLENIILDLRSEYLGKSDGYRLAIKSRLYELALLLLREVPARQVLPGELERQRSRNEILERVLSFVNERYPEEITLDDAAAAANLSRFYFSRFFRAQTGQSFHGYLCRLRVSRAEELLAGTEDTVTDIAYRCGFESLKTFNRVFRTYAGTSPSGFRADDGRGSRRGPVAEMPYSGAS